MAYTFPLNDFLLTPDGRSPQKEAFFCTARNQCFSSGYGAGKTWLFCKKITMLAMAFPKSRWFIGRVNYTDLMRTTIATFKSVCPREYYDEKQGGRLTKDACRFINGSEILFIHLSKDNEQLVRGLEVNGGFVDQAEELDENIYLHLDVRCGRWSKGEVPDYMVTADFPRDPLTNKPRVPSYLLLACNPDTELHYIYRRYHPDSIEHQVKYSHNHKMIFATTLDNPTIDPQIIAEMMTRDQVFIDRFVYGKWGTAESSIHRVLNDSILEVSEEWVKNLLQKSRLYRVLDHGDSAPTCCLWVASYNRMYYVYREYYEPDRVISFHRKRIQEHSADEVYAANYIDPACVNKTGQRGGIRYSVADEYADTTLLTDSKSIRFTPAQHDEMAIRNRINECLRIDESLTHPITKVKGAPRLYFIKKTEEYIYGAYQSILQTKNQKREILGTENGKPIYSDERDDSVTDHAYDAVRYFIGMHHMNKVMINSAPPPGSFYAAVKEAKKMRKVGNVWNRL